MEACAIFYVGRITGFEYWNNVFVDKQAMDVYTADIWTRYTWSVFQAVGNTFPMNFRPETVLEQWLTIIYILSGAVLYATFVGSLSSAAVALDASGRLYEQKMDELTDYLNFKCVGPETRKKLVQYYEVKYRGKFFEESNLLAGMNDSLRTELSVHNCRQLIEKVPFLRRQEHDNKDSLFFGKVASSLVACYYVKNDYVVRQGELGNDMYFIQSGSLDIVVNGTKVTTFTEGHFFGEVALIANIPRTASVRAHTASILYRLSRTDFDAILMEFDDMRLRIDRIYQERMAKVRQEQEEKRRADEERLLLLRQQQELEQLEQQQQEPDHGGEKAGIESTPPALQIGAMFQYSSGPQQQSNVVPTNDDIGNNIVNNNNESTNTKSSRESSSDANNMSMNRNKGRSTSPPPPIPSAPIPSDQRGLINSTSLSQSQSPLSPGLPMNLPSILIEPLPLSDSLSQPHLQSHSQIVMPVVPEVDSEASGSVGAASRSTTVHGGGMQNQQQQQEEQPGLSRLPSFSFSSAD
ncbi:hypothetical protein HDU76_004412 [Blyttiomyces sp. JEL0837]|nr:hypothetical protein HDU76_004412 [Blyttiomyces sp. JEL0837]